MKYKIEQWDNKNKKWFEVGESNSRYVALCSCLELKKKYNDTFYRIVGILDLI